MMTFPICEACPFYTLHRMAQSELLQKTAGDHAVHGCPVIRIA